MAAEDTKGKKRKGAPASSPKAKKAKNSLDEAGATKPAKSAKPIRAGSVRKQAADFMDVDDAPAPAPEAAKPTKAKKAKASKEVGGEEFRLAVSDSSIVEGTGNPEKQGKQAEIAEAESAPVKEAPKDKTKRGKKAEKADVAVLAEEAAPAHVTVTKHKSKRTKSGAQVETEELVAGIATGKDEVVDVDEVDDQTAALLAGFGSDDDSDDPSEDLDFDEDIAVPKLNAKQRKAVAKAEQAAKSNEPGVIYVGRVPRGFFEKQMKQYFSQFGRVNRLRLSRNKKTGASKHFAFVEFASTEVADIVARTMDNYLLFGHILKCKLVPDDQVHPDLFKGAGQRFKVDPRNKKAGLAMERGAERPQWEKRVAIENKRRTGRNQKLKEEFGYEFTAPALKTIEDVPKAASVLESVMQQEILKEVLVEDTTALKQAAAKKGKKGAKATSSANEEVATSKAIQELVEQPVTGKKNKKRKSDAALELIAVSEEKLPAQAAPKTKKPKKETKLDMVIEETKVEAAAKPKKSKKVKA